MGYDRPAAGGSVKWNLIAAKMGNRRTDSQVARRWRELSGERFYEWGGGDRWMR